MYVDIKCTPVCWYRVYSCTLTSSILMFRIMFRHSDLSVSSILWVRPMVGTRVRASAGMLLSTSETESVDFAVTNGFGAKVFEGWKSDFNEAKWQRLLNHGGPRSSTTDCVPVVRWLFTTSIEDTLSWGRSSSPVRRTKVRTRNVNDSSDVFPPRIPPRTCKLHKCA